MGIKMLIANLIIIFAACSSANSNNLQVNLKCKEGFRALAELFSLEGSIARDIEFANMKKFSGAYEYTYDSRYNFLDLLNMKARNRKLLNDLFDACIR